MLKFEVETFLEDLNKQPWALVYSFDDPDESYSLLLYLLTLYSFLPHSQLCPISTVNLSKPATLSYNTTGEINICLDFQVSLTIDGRQPLQTL